jgi:hypothetical protein
MIINNQITFEELFVLNFKYNPHLDHEKILSKAEQQIFEITTD